MAARKTAHEKVMDLVEHELKKNPKASTTELYERAKGVSRTVSQLSIRQFHAKYPLQVKRRRSAKTTKGTRSKAERRAVRRETEAPTVGADREAIRKVLLDFAGEVAGAQSQADLVEVIARVDRYVDRVLDAARSDT